MVALLSVPVTALLVIVHDYSNDALVGRDPT